jgi:hypothetical protein
MTTDVCAPKSESAKKNEDWMNTKWRPAMGWMYMLVCITDFVLFPILWSLIQVHGDGKVESQWVPITLQGAGLFHIAMGAILGIAAYGRTQEKMTGTNNGGLQVPTPPAPSFGAPATAPRAHTPAPTFGNAPLGGNTVSTAPSFGRGPIQPEQPEI